MKTQCFTFLALLFVVFVFSQEKTIRYTIANDQYTLNGKPIDNKTLLQKNTNYKVLIADYNPFYYKINFDTKGKDNLKDFFEFVVKSTKIDLTTLPSINTSNLTILNNNDSGFKDVVDEFITDYYSAYLISHELKSKLFNYEKLKTLNQSIKNRELLKAYLAIKLTLQSALNSDEDIDEILKKSGLPTQSDVEKLDLLLIDVENVLNRYKNNGSSFPVGSFNTNLNTSVSTTITLTPLNTEKEAIKSEKTINVKSGFNVSFSSGIITAWNAEKQYYTNKLSNGNYTIDVESERKIMPAVAALGNITLNSKNNLPEIGLCVGASIDIELTPNVLLGLTFAPKNSNILISSGIGLSYQKKISDKYKLNTEYTEEPKLDAKKDIYQRGFWLGISYKIL